MNTEKEQEVLSHLAELINERIIDVIGRIGDSSPNPFRQSTP